MIIQRFLDLVFSLIALFIFAPFLFLVCVVLKFTGEGEIFYLQPRIGRYGKEFKLIKFATMLKNSPNLGSRNITLKNDPRVLPFGSFLRKTKINELPQLINILSGDMSIVGPRPLTPDIFEFYTDEVKRSISVVRPGLSGVGSIVFRDEEELLSKLNESEKYYKSHISVIKGELEVWYVKNASLKLYLCVILSTLIVLFFKVKNPLNFFYNDIPDIDGRL